MTFTSVFGGSTIYPAQPTYRAFTLSANTTLQWPTESVTTGNIVAAINDVTPSGAGFSVRMPPANEASEGETALFFNVGASSFTVADNGGNTIVSLAPGQAWQVLVTDNSTVNGTWRSTQYGAGTSIATAGSLVGAGIKAIGTTLNQSMSATGLNTNYSIGDADRSEVFNWVGGAGTLTLPSAATVGNDWFVHTRNSGTGGVTISTSVGGQNINGGASIILNPGDSAIVFCDGSNFFTIGLGRSAAFAFDFVSIDLTGQPSPYILSGANLNRIAYRFTGTITSNVQVVVPNTVQQYWVTNSTSLTSDPYSIEIKTLAGLGVTVLRNQRAIMYCDGTDVIDADSAGISLPLSIAQGGTGATNNSAARINLGATATGNSLFTAVSASAGRSTLGASVIGDALFTEATAAGARTTIGAAASGAVGSSGVTMSTARMLGRTTAGTGAIEEITIGSGLSLSAGTLVATAPSSGVTSVSGTGSVNGITLSGTVTTAGSITLGGALSGIDLTSQITGTLPIANGGTGVTTAPANGRLLIGNGTGYTVANLTAGAGISITNGAGSITIASTAGGGAVTSVSVSGGTTGLTFSGNPITTSGTITMAGTLAVANGGTGATTEASARTNLGATATGNSLFTAASAAAARGTLGASTVGENIFTLTNPGAVTFLTINADNTVSARSAALYRGDLGLGSAAVINVPVTVGNGGTGATTFTANRLLRGNGTGAFTASIVHDTGSAVGISTTSPTELLDVNGTVKGRSGFKTDDEHYFYSINATSIGLRVGASGPFYAFRNTSGSNMVIDNASGGDVALAVSGTSVFNLTGTGALTSPNRADTVGFKGAPQVSRTANFSLALTDIGLDQYINGTTAGQTVTIPANASVAFPIGTIIPITNDSNQNWSIAITSDTLFWSPSGGTGTRTLAAGGQCTIKKVTATRWWISGVGLS